MAAPTGDIFREQALCKVHEVTINPHIPHTADKRSVRLILLAIVGTRRNSS